MVVYLLLIFALSGSKMPTKMRQHVAKICRSINFPGDSIITWAPGGPQNGGKMTWMDILEFRDISGPVPMPKYGAIRRLNRRLWGESPTPTPHSIFRVNVLKKAGFKE